MTRQEPRLIESGPAVTRSGLVHRVSQPAGTPPHPTVVMIHGRSGNEDVTWVFARTMPEHYLLVAPRAIKEDPDGGYSWHLRGEQEWPTLAQFDEAVAHLVRFIEALPELYGADPRRIYLMGFSQGAAASYALAIRYPKLVQGIAGLVGFMPTETEEVARAAPLRGLPIFMAVGKEDERIPYGRSQSSAQGLRAAGADLEYHEYETGHKLNAAGMRDLKDWWARRESSAA